VQCAPREPAGYKRESEERPGDEKLERAVPAVRIDPEDHFDPVRPDEGEGEERAAQRSEGQLDLESPSTASGHAASKPRAAGGDNLA
jgi:hypothetical protein